MYGGKWCESKKVTCKKTIIWTKTTYNKTIIFLIQAINKMVSKCMHLFVDWAINVL
jgi:hypothetical protein